MAIRVNKLLTELNIGLQTLDDTLKSLGYKEEFLTPNSKIPDDIAILVKGYFSEGADFLKVVKAAAEKGVYGHKDETHPDRYRQFHHRHRHRRWRGPHH